MELFFSHDENGRIVAAGTQPVHIVGNETTKLKVEEEHDVLKNFAAYKMRDGKLVKDQDNELAHAKEVKRQELGERCQQVIESGFYCEVSGVEYFFSYDNEAQHNFSNTLMLLNADQIDAVQWTAKRNGEYVRLSLTAEQFYDVATAGHLHKENNISKLRDFIHAQIQAAQTLSEVNEITF